MPGRLLLPLALAVAGLAAPGLPAAAQQQPSFAELRPRPYPPFESAAFQRAVARGTRTRSGRPGPAYWQQRASYRLAATLDSATDELAGEGTVGYRNQSPDTLRVVWFHLYQNLFAPGEPRNRATPVTGGLRLSRVTVGGLALSATAADTTVGYRIDGTRMRVQLPAPLPPGGSAEFGFAWSFRVAPDGAPRGGEDGEVFFLSYWYPQVAVYDDLSGWQTDAYLGNAEFYMGYADYDVALSVPAGWLVAATGELENPEEVLSPAVRARLARAAMEREPVHVVSEADRGPGRATALGTGGRLTWRYTARDVRDFAFGVSPHYLWDATAAVVVAADRAQVRADAPPLMIHAFYRPGRRAWAWDQAARYARHSIEFLSRYLWGYSYPHATAVDGVRSCAGMEYPMLTCIGGPRDTLALYSVIVHELAHMWFPMQVGSDEKRYAWQDEGFTRFNQAQGMADFFRGLDREAGARRSYLAVAGTDDEVELMRHGDLYPPESPAYGVASYDKMATNLATLRGLLGDQRFRAAYREYGRRWRGKHPSPWDFFYTVNDVARRDLWWFWRAWWFETWTLDQAVAAVRPSSTGDSTTIVIEDRGLVPMPVRLAVRRLAGGTERYEVPVEVWLAGARRYELTVPGASVASVVIDPEELFPDRDRTNNMWRWLGGPTAPSARPSPPGGTPER